MSDTGAPNLTSLKIENPVLRNIAAFVGEIARPFAIIITACGAADATIVLAAKVSSAEAAIFIGAVFTGIAALYFGKAWEKVTQIKQGGQ